MRTLTLRMLNQLVDGGAHVRFFASKPHFEQGNLHLGIDVRSNLLQVPEGQAAETWKEIVAKTFCEANGIYDRRIHNVFASQINILYQEHGIYSNMELSKNVHALHIYDKFAHRLLNTQYDPSFDESNLITSKLDPLKNPRLRDAFCHTAPDDEELIVRSTTPVITVVGQMEWMTLNTWYTLLALNKIYEQRKGVKTATKMLVCVEEDILTPMAASGTWEFVTKNAQRSGIVTAVVRTS